MGNKLGKERKVKSWVTPEWVKEQYVIKNRSGSEIAKEIGLTLAGFKNYLDRHKIYKDIHIITKEEYEKAINNGLTRKELSKLFNKSTSVIDRLSAKFGTYPIAKEKYKSYNSDNDELIVKLYNQGKSTTEIGKIIGISHSTVRNHLTKIGVKKRGFRESQFVFNGKQIPKDFYNYEKMYDLYIDQRLSKKELGLLYNVDPGTIDRTLKDLHIPIRSNSEAKIGQMIGEKHPNWQGGITSLHMRLREAFNVQLTPIILKRDKYKCQLCGSKKKLHVHHIKPFKDILQRIIKEHPEYDPIKNVNELYEIAVNDSEFLDQTNLITYCKECHLFKVHGYQKSNNNVVCGTSEKSDLKNSFNCLETLNETTSNQASKEEGSETMETVELGSSNGVQYIQVNGNGEQLKS